MLMSPESTKKAVAKQALGVGLGTAVGAMTGRAVSGTMPYNPHVPRTAIQAGQAAGAALRNGAGVSGAAAAGAAVLTAKAAAIGTAAVAAAPFVAGAAAVGAIGYAAYRLFSDGRK
jgi:hypothetical protein